MTYTDAGQTDPNPSTTNTPQVVGAAVGGAVATALILGLRQRHRSRSGEAW